MISYKEALDIAKKCCGEVDVFVFSKDDDFMNIDGTRPVVVLKETR